MTYSLDEDLELAVKAAKEACPLVLSFYHSEYEVREKSPNNPVTEADIATDKLLQKLLLEHRPEYGWLSEEEVDDGSRGTCKKTWFVDPIDGTRAFIRGVPHFTISIALVENHIPIVGVIINPITNELFTATKGNGAYKNGEKIKTNSTDDVNDAKMLGDAHMFQSKQWPQPWNVKQIEQRNSIAYRMALVACGDFDAAIATTEKNDWDLAAGTLILEEAGGFAGNHWGDEFTFNKTLKQRSLLACCNDLRAQLLDRLAHIQ